MTDSILDSVKKVIGYEPDYTAFDIDIIMHINSVFSTLQQIGVGPPEGFAIADSEAKWVDFTKDDPRINSVKTYMSMRARLIFDPPATSFVITSMNEQIKEFEWRLHIQMDKPTVVIAPVLGED